MVTQYEEKQMIRAQWSRTLLYVLVLVSISGCFVDVLDNPEDAGDTDTSSVGGDVTPQGDTDTDADTDGDGDVDTDSDGDSDSDSDGDTDVDTDIDTDVDTDTDSDVDTDVDSDIDGDVDSDTDADTDSDTDSGTDDTDSCVGCLIEGVCYDNRHVNDDNECEICNADELKTGWSNNEKTCNDELYCTVNDSCREGVCTGDPRDCDDGLSCTSGDSCDDDIDDCVPGASTCKVGESCSADGCSEKCEGCLIEGLCVTDGQSSTGNECLICRVSELPTGWSPAIGAECNDQDDCTYGDKCNAQGQCDGTGIDCDDEEGTCGANLSCNGTSQCTVTHPGIETSCEDNDGCTIQDHCNGQGQCVGGGVRSCNDYRDCTTDTCESGDCTFSPNGNGCLVNGQCVPNGGVNPSNECQHCDPAQNREGWSGRPASTLCQSDNQYCNGDEHCDGNGSCVAGTNPCAGMSGPCAEPACDEARRSCFKADSEICAYDVKQYSCSSDDGRCGNVNAMSRTGDQHCSGKSANCDGTIVWDNGENWDSDDRCNDGEKCVLGSDGASSCVYDSTCGIWCDDATNLCWENKPTGNPKTYSEAESYCWNLRLGDYTDWTLPTINELITVLSGCQDGVAISGAESLCAMEPDTCGDSYGGQCTGQKLCDSCSESSSCYLDSHIQSLSGNCDNYWSTNWVVDFVFIIRTSLGDIQGTGASANDFVMPLCRRRDI